MRKTLEKKNPLKTEEKTCSLHYKEVSLFPPPSFSHLKALHIWPRKQHMMVALPHLDGHLTGTLFMPLQGEKSFESLQKPKEMETFFQSEFHDLSNWKKEEELFLKSFPNPLIGIKTEPWFFQNKVLLMGDAAHAMWPFLGQGMNAGFEDVSVFLETLDANEKKRESEKKSLEEIFKAFFESRFPNTSALSQMSEENEYEMRHQVSKASFLVQKQVDLLLEQSFPDKYQSTYRLLAFSHTPYREILIRKRRQEAVLHKICKELKEVKALDLMKAKKILEETRTL